MHRHAVSLLPSFVLATFTLLMGADTAFSKQPGPESVDFNRDVRPIFNEHCVACHGGVKQAADLSFVYEESVSYVVEAGDPEASTVYERVTLPADDDLRMPPADHGNPLSEAEVSVLRRWIERGAKWGNHWAFEAPKKHDPPELEDDAWSRRRVDRFVLGRLREVGLEPQPAAKPERWLRRVSLDLTGLPPTPQQIDEFLSAVKTNREAAYEEAVDRLLDSPAFGERWASVWLDVVRYADSKGLGLDARRTIWPYRDWVIRAFNDDMPYDQFTIRQLAGDLLPDATMDDLVASACHRATQTNEEGGTDDETFRTEAVMDRVNTTWQAWQGVSFGCVQCHSHPYDPIQHEEYYSFLAHFNNTADSDLGSEAPTVSVPVDHDDFEKARSLDRKISALWRGEWELAQRRIDDETRWTALKGLSASTDNGTQVVVRETPAGEEFQTTGTVQRNTTITIEAPIDESLQQLTAIRFTGLPKDEEKARIDSEWGFVVSHFDASVVSAEGEERNVELGYVISDEPEPILNPQDSLNPKSRGGFGAYSRIHYPRTGVFVLQTPMDVEQGDRLRVKMAFKITETGAFPLVADRGRFSVTGDEALSYWLTDTDRVAKREQIKQLKSERGAIKSVRTPVMAERVDWLARPTHVFDRGNQTTKTDPVEPGTPEFLPPEDSSDDVPARLRLARWIASPENPLTARVAVNRFWAQMFGTGIVATQEDFGAAGDPPSHPLLLDDLAVRFQSEMDWSIKRLLRELVLSATYRQSSVASSESLEKDAANRWLSRGPKTRLPAETIRDQALFVAGLLSEKRFGPPAYPPIPEGVWNPFQGGDRWSTPNKDDPDRYRRTVYTYTKRTIPYPVMAAFDAPSREFCSVRRLRSNTPLQALMTLNDATFVEASQGLANQMENADGAIEEKLQYGFRRATCRQPSDVELAALKTLFDERGAESEREGLVAVASVLLNLDEVLTK
jgi:hypothetical protein